jgi:ribose transport system substrate-binding protein
MKAARFLLSFACASALLLGWGCKKPTDSKSSTVTIAYVTNGVDPFWDLCAAGVRIAEKEFNIKCEVHMPTKGVVDQKRIMESLLAKGVDGIAISPIDAANQTKFLNEIAQNTKLITQDADAPDSDRLAYIGTNNYLAGRALGKLVKAAIPEGGEVFILVGRLEQLNARQRRQGVIDELLGKPEQELGSVKFDAEDAKNLTAEGSKYIILETRTDNFDKAKAKSNAESGIAKYKNLKCMVGLFAYNPPACLDAIKDAGLTGKIKVCGFDEPDAMLQAIKDGTAYGTISQQPWKYGYESVKMLKNILDGQAPASTFLEVPFLVVTKENVDEFWKTKREMAELGKQ